MLLFQKQATLFQKQAPGATLQQGAAFPKMPQKAYAALSRAKLPIRKYEGDLYKALSALKIMTGGRHVLSYAAAYAYVVHGVLAPDLERGRLSAAGSQFRKLTGEYDNMDAGVRRCIAQYFQLENPKFKMVAGSKNNQTTARMLQLRDRPQRDLKDDFWSETVTRTSRGKPTLLERLRKRIVTGFGGGGCCSTQTQRLGTGFCG